MSKYKHTPGPWKHDTDFHLYKMDDYSQIVAGPGYTDDEHGVVGFSITGYMSDADAKLIAAAPELLEALKECHNAMRCGDPNEETTSIAWWAIVEKAESIIQKTTI